MISAALVLLLPVCLPAQQDDTVRDFKRFFRRLSDPSERAEFVHSLQDVDDPEVARVLVPLLADREPRVAKAALDVLGRLPSPAAREPLKEILAHSLKARELAGVIRAVARGGWPGFASAVRSHLGDRDDEVRLWGATAAGRLGDEEALPLLAPLATGDRNALVRAAAVDAIGRLGRIDRELAGAALVAALGDAELPVQTAACLALRRVRVAAAVPVLIGLLEHGTGRVLESAYATLLEITDMQFTDDPEMWRRWWDQAGASWKMPTDEEVAARRADRAQATIQYRPSRQQASFTGVATTSERIAFVLDISGSMEDMVVDRDAFRKRGHTLFGKLDVVKKEMITTVSNLDPDVRFNVYAFASHVHPWKPNLKKANALNRRSAIAFIDRLQPLGGKAARERAAAGLSGSSGVDEGKTNTYAALLAGMGLTGEEDPAEKTKSKVDTVFFLSDGRPSVGALVDPDDILARIRELNRYRRVTIHTIAIGEFQRDFMEKLARANGGVFTNLGR